MFRMYLLLFTVALQSLTDVGQSLGRQREHRRLLAVPLSTVLSVLVRDFSPRCSLSRPSSSLSDHAHPMEPCHSAASVIVLCGGVTAAETETAVRDHILGKVPFHP